MGSRSCTARKAGGKLNVEFSSAKVVVLATLKKAVSLINSPERVDKLRTCRVGPIRIMQRMY